MESLKSFFPSCTRAWGSAYILVLSWDFHTKGGVGRREVRQGQRISKCKKVTELSTTSQERPARGGCLRKASIDHYVWEQYPGLAKRKDKQFICLVFTFYCISLVTGSGKEVTAPTFPLCVTWHVGRSLPQVEHLWTGGVQVSCTLEPTSHWGWQMDETTEWSKKYEFR